MGKFKTYVLSLLFFVIMSGQAHAVTSSCTGSFGGMIQTACNSCLTLINTNLDSSTPANQLGIVAPLVQCFTAIPFSTNTTDLSTVTGIGIIPAVAYSFMTNNTVVNYYTVIVRAMAVLLVIAFGISIVSGNAPDFKKEGFTLLFKVAGVFYFLSAAPTIYTELLQAVQGVSDALATGAANVIGQIPGQASSLCVATSTLTAPVTATGATIPGLLLWQSWDCILGYLFGFSDTAGAAQKTAGIAAFLLWMFFTKSAGTLLFSVAVYVIMTVIYSAARFVHMYLMFILGFSFLFMFGYIFVPLLLFKQTMPYFQKWMYGAIGQLLSPIILVGYMGMMVVAVDFSLFSGPYSIATLMTGSAATSGSNAFATFLAKPGNMISCIHTLLYTVHNNNPSDQGTGSVSSGCDDMNAPTSTSAVPQPSQVSGGVPFTSVHVSSTTAEATEAAAKVNNQPLSITANSIDLPHVASATGVTDAATYLTNLLIGFCSSGLLLYVMYALLKYIPELTQDLVGESSRAVDLQREQAFMEQTMRGSQPGVGQGAGGAAASAVGGFLGKGQ